MPQRQHLVNISSRDRVTGSASSTDFRVTLPVPIQNPVSMSLLACEIPFTAYPVRSPYNTFVFVRGTTTYTTTIAEGIYSISGLVTALQSRLSAVDPSTTFQVTSSSSLLKLTITANASITIGSSQLGMMLGFVAGQAGTSIQATNTYSTSLDTYVFIDLPRLPSSIVSSQKATFRVQVPVDSSFILYNAVNSSYPQEVDLTGTGPLAEISVRLLDIFGNVLPLNGSEWSMFLRIVSAS